MAEEPNARDAKLIQYLNEAYGKEKELETSLKAHIAMTTRAPYKKRLQQHLKETKAHAKRVERRIKQLGGKAAAVDVPGPEALAEAATTAQGLASKAVAAAKGPLHFMRGTGEQEKMLKNAKTELSEEHEEIAHYTAVETLADTVGDGETAKLARGIRREEQRMAAFLEKQIPTLTKAVAQEEIPASQRRRSKSSSRSRRASSRTRGPSSRSSKASSASSTSSTSSDSSSRSRGA